MDKSSLLKRIEESRSKSLLFYDSLATNGGFKYTVNHNVEQYPSALLYGTWAVGMGKHLVSGTALDQEQNVFIQESLLKERMADGTFFPSVLRDNKPAKSFEYMKLHCTNYATGALMQIDPEFDFQSSFMDRYLDADYLNLWLDQRAFNRPWEESNNIVNVASYLASCNDNGNSAGKERLYQMLEWHNRYQNSKTGGFDNFASASKKNVLQSMAGAVHNFHIHLYLNEPLNYESKIAKNVTQFLFEGPLTACLSIDFVELGCRTYSHCENKDALRSALLYHLKALLEYQNEDGGWYENESASRPTTANGMKEQSASSCSYATWFRMCSIGMIAITLLGDDPKNWKFRNTLGMGYAPDRWTMSDDKIAINQSIVRQYKIKNIPSKTKDWAIKTAAKLIR